MKKNKALTAGKLRYILMASLVLLFIIGGGGFYFAQNLLKGYAKETSTLNSQASVSDQNLEALRNIQAYLAAHEQDQELARRVVADSKEYRYQNEIVADISKFAGQSGISITAYNFTSDTSTGTTGGGSTGTTTPPATGGTTTPATPATGGVSSLKSTKVNVTIKSPVNYAKLLDFISRIEQNITKMQIAGISLTRSDEGGKSQVSSESFDIEVYIR